MLTRVVSKPGDHRVCLDLGHKAIASERPHPRVLLIQPASTIDRASNANVLGAPILEATFVGHSEEHLVFETPDAASLDVGDVLYGIPWHVCPTVALHGQAVVVRDRPRGRIAGGSPRASAASRSNPPSCLLRTRCASHSGRASPCWRSSC